jgi:hypothetical protein
MSTTVVNLRAVYPGRGFSPEHVYIGRAAYQFRASKWANPFKLRRGAGLEERVACLAKFQAWIETQPHLLADLHELRGKVLVCWCAPLPCHGDLLALMADALPDPPGGGGR